MNRFLAAICGMIFALAAVGSAKAGDFTGFYVGASAGGVNGNSHANTLTVFSPTGYFASSSPGAINSVGSQHLTPAGFSGVGLTGFYFQYHHVVIGGEAEFGHNQAKGFRSGTAAYPCCVTTGFTVTQRVKSDWTFLAGPRMGLAFGRSFFYLKGGAAMTNLNYQGNFTDTFASATENGSIQEVVNGWAGGFGAEFRLTHHVSLRGEYLRYDFGSRSIVSTNLMAFTPRIAFPSNPFTHVVYLRENVGRIGFNYRF